LSSIICPVSFRSSKKTGPENSHCFPGLIECKISNQTEKEQGESGFWARIIMHMLRMHISIIMLLMVN
jgi:hypothetical protein